jgi:hypothetical protein
MIEPRYGVLQTLFADRVFRIPRYQRFYSWQRRQRDDLFSDLKKLASGNEDQHHFMATLVCHRTSETKAVGTAQYRVFDVVDGQQRLTTLIILLKCIELSLAEDSEDRKDLGKVLVKRDGHLILLQTNNSNEYIFNRFIREGIAPTQADILTHSDRNLSNAIRDCKQFVEDWKSSKDVLSLMRLLLHRLGFVVYDTEDSRVVYTVFEVLNSRGLAVDWLDKTKSVLMGRMYELSSSPMATEAEIATLQDMWSQIYREIAKEDIPGDETLRIMATLYYGPERGKPLSAEESLDVLRKECSSFDKPRKVSERLLDVARKLVSLYGSAQLEAVTEILHARLLAVAIMIASGLNEDERHKVLQQWERVSFRIFGLARKDSRTKVGDYVRLAYKIVTEDIETRTYNQIMAGLRKLGEEYPINEALKEGVIGKDCYERPEVCRYLLWLFEEELAKRLGAGATVDDQERRGIWKLRASESIEHIFPQNPPSGPAWRNKMRSGAGLEQPICPNVGRIGNLMLLPIRLNQEAQVLSFDNKKEIYAKHNLRMVQAVCSENDWTLAEIEARETRIADWATSRWSDI